MRLRLNTTLRAALIAAITAVGFTLTQAQATELNKIMTMSDMVKSATVQGEGAKASTVWEIQATDTMAANVVYDFDGSSYLTGITNSNLISTLNGSSYVTIAAWINPTSHAGGAGSVEKGDGGAIFGYGAQNDGIKLIDNNGATKATTKGQADFNNAKASGIDTASDTWQLVAITFHASGNNTEVKTMVGSNISSMQSSTGMKTPAQTDQVFAIGSSNYNKARELFQGSIAGLTVFTSDNWVTTAEVAGAMYAEPTKIVYPTQTWAGTPEQHDWSNAVWVSDGGDPTVFDPKNVAEFTGAGHKEVSITTAASASNVTVGGQDYTFNLSAGGSLTTGTLTVNNDATLALTGVGTVTATEIAASGTTINIGEDVTLQGVSTGAATLAGKGTYVLKNGTTSMGSIVLDGNWTGIVCITSVNQQNIDLSQYVKGTASTVELKGFTGWTNNWSGTITQNIKLTNNGDNAAWSIGAFSSKEQPEATFTGTWSGTGTFKRTSGNNMHYKYTGNISAWEGKFLMESGTTNLTFAGSATAVNAEIAKSGGTLNVVVGDGTNNFSTTFSKAITANTLTVKDKATATISGDLTANTITVNAGGTMNMGSGTLSTAITNSGSVVLTDTVLDSNGFSEEVGGTAYYALDGTKVEETANHYTGSAESYVQVVNNAEGATSSGTAVWNEQTINLESDGRIVTGQGGVNYATFYVTTGETLSNITGSVHGDALEAINVTGGELVVNESASGIAITVSDDASISGSNLDLTEVGIAAGKTASVEQPLAVSGVKFTAAEGEAVSVQNNGNQTAQYSLTDKNMWVTAGKLEMTDTENNVTVSNSVWMWDGDLVNTTGKTLTLDNMDALILQNMNITGSTVELTYDNGKEQVVEGTVNISGILEAGNATLKADLTLLGGSTLNVAGGGDNALTLGSTFTIDTTDGPVNLDEDTIAALNDMQGGDKLDLIVALNTELDPLSYGGKYDGVSYDQLFSAAGLQGNYTVYAQGDAFGLMKSTSPIPEPTTGTLSLLALAALAARRRRK